jgi:hypothetical protein
MPRIPIEVYTSEGSTERYLQIGETNRRHLTLFLKQDQAAAAKVIIDTYRNVEPNRAYYAHPLSLYGSEQEKRDVDLIESMGYECLNPNSAACDAGYKRYGMEYFIDLVKSCRVLFFRGFPDCTVPAGIGEEINYARSAKIPVLELPNAISRRILNVEATRETLREVGSR